MNTHKEPQTTPFKKETIEMLKKTINHLNSERYQNDEKIDEVQLEINQIESTLKTLRCEISILENRKNDLQNFLFIQQKILSSSDE